MVAVAVAGAAAAAAQQQQQQRRFWRLRSCRPSRLCRLCWLGQTDPAGPAARKRRWSGACPAAAWLGREEAAATASWLAM